MSSHSQKGTPMTDVTKFITAMFALSIGLERTVEIAKNVWTSLPFTLPQKMVAHWSKQKGKDSPPARSALIQVLTAVLGGVLVYNIGPDQFLGDSKHTDTTSQILVSALLGALSSGGSAFWNQLLSLVTAAKQTRETATRILNDWARLEVNSNWSTMSRAGRRHISTEVSSEA